MLVEGISPFSNENQPDFAISSDSRLLIGRTPAASIAMHAALVQGKFPFDTADWEYEDPSNLVIEFRLRHDFRDEIRAILQENAPLDE